MDVLRVQFRMLFQDLARPFGVLLDILAILLQRGAGGQRSFQLCHLALQTAGQHGQAHHFDQADVLLFDVMELGMGVEYAKRMLGRGDVVAQHQVQLELAVPHPGNGGNGVVRLALGLGVHKAALIGVSPPGSQDLVGQLHQTLVIGAGQADAAHGPMDDTGFYILKTGKVQLFSMGALAMANS